MLISENKIKEAAIAHAERKAEEGKAEAISDYEAGMRDALSLKTSLAGHGSHLIELERLDHLKRGYDAAHDDKETQQRLPIAAALYTADGTGILASPHLLWPWPDAIYPDRRGKLDRKRQLVIAGGLIAAEIDRLIRKENRDAGIDTV